MTDVLIRNVPPATHRALKELARRNGRSTQAQILALLEEATRAGSTPGLGSRLSEIGQRSLGPDLPLTRDAAPYEPLDLA